MGVRCDGSDGDRGYQCELLSFDFGLYVIDWQFLTLLFHLSLSHRDVCFQGLLD